MSIEKKSKGYPKANRNPFIEKMNLKYSTKKASYSINDRNISIVDEKNGDRLSEVTQISQTYKVDKAKFTKIYHSALRNIFLLKTAGMRLLLTVLDQIQNSPSSDEISLAYVLVKEDMSISMYTRGVRELFEAEIIYPTIITNRWYINPSIIFNGDRIVLTQRYELDNSNETIDMDSGEILQGEIVHV